MAVPGRDGGRQGNEVFGETAGVNGKAGSPASTITSAGTKARESAAITTGEFPDKIQITGTGINIKGGNGHAFFVSISSG
jgi:hypothetical protein